MAFSFSSVLSGETSLESFYRETYGSVENMIKRAKDGEAQAQTDLGNAYAFGLENFIEKDSKKAIGWLNSAIDKGFVLPGTLHTLGTLYDNEGSIVCRRKAYELYHKAADLGCAEAQLNLAEMYRCGVEGVVNEDLKTAFEWYKKAVDEDVCERDATCETLRKLGSARENSVKYTALKKLFSNYMEGDCPEGKPQPGKAIHYLTRAAELGDTEAQRQLGEIYMNGKYDQPKDLAKARRWITKASDKGEPRARKLLQQLPEQRDETQAPNTSDESVLQSLEIMEEKIQKRAETNFHPYYISRPMLFTECLLENFEHSPTARQFLTSYKLVKRGFDILFKSEFTDVRGISLIAQGYLTECSILQSFIVTHEMITQMFQLCEKTLVEKPTFFEGLLLSVIFQEPQKVLTSFKGDTRNVGCLKNLIGFIQKAEPDTPITKNPLEFGKNYSSWLHVLHYMVGSNYLIQEVYSFAVEAFERSLACCPSYIDSKRGLGYSLMNMSCDENEKSKQSTQHIDPNFKPFTTKYDSWSAKELKKVASKVLKEYLSETAGCDRHYPNACYYLAFIEISNGNMTEFKKYYELGQDAEEKRLSFLAPVDLPLKDMMSPMYQLLSSIPK